MRYRAVVVENEELSMSRIKRLLAAFSNDFEVVGQAEDGIRAVVLIDSTAPDVVFLDIDLPGLNGFEVLARVRTRPSVIFMTAFKQFAVEAFKQRAIDYLLKPLNEEDIATALKKLRAVTASNIPRPASAAVIGQNGRIRCRAGDRIVLVKLVDIVYFRAGASHSMAFTFDGKLAVDSSLDDLQTELTGFGFFRIDAAIVNLSCIDAVHDTDDGGVLLVLRDLSGTHLPVSASCAAALKRIRLSTTKSPMGD
jgi:two-component system LytT family response regulator